MKITPLLKKYTLYLALLVIPTLVAVPAAYKYKDWKASHPGPQVAGEANTNEEVASLVAQIGKLVLLPEGETPTIATVTEKEKLSNQYFYKNAENGDKVLIYREAKVAYLYRPSINKIIQIAPVTVSEPSSVPSATPSAKP